MKRIIYALLLVAPLMNACAPWCGKIQEKPAESQKSTAALSVTESIPSEIRHTDLNEQLLQATKYGWPYIVQKLIIARADAHSVDPSLTYKAGLLAVKSHEKKDFKKLEDYVAVIQSFRDTGVNIESILEPFINKEPFKTASKEHLINEGLTSEEADKRLDSIAIAAKNTQPFLAASPLESDEKKTNTKK
jgi:hypothetical protein